MASILHTAKFSAWSCSSEGSASTGHAQLILACLGITEYTEKGQSNVKDVTDDNAIITSILRNADSGYLLGDASSLPEIKQWMSLARSLTKDDLQAVDKRLSTKTYLVGHAFSVADVAVFVAIRVTCVDVVNDYANVQRWFDQVQHVCRRGVFEPVTITVKAVSQTVSKDAAAAGSKGKTNDTKLPPPPPVAAAVTPPAATTAGDGKTDKKEKKKETKAAAPAAEAPTEDVLGNKRVLFIIPNLTLPNTISFPQSHPLSPNLPQPHPTYLNLTQPCSTSPQLHLISFNTQPPLIRSIAVGHPSRSRGEMLEPS